MEQLKQFCKEGWDKVRHNDLIRPGNRKKKIMVLIGLSVFLLACGLTAWFYGKPLLEFVLDTGRFRAWMNEHGALGPLAFVAIRTVQTVVKIIPAEPLEIGAGYAFGSWWGMALCMLGTAIGSLIIIVRHADGGGVCAAGEAPILPLFAEYQKAQSAAFHHLLDSRHTEGPNHLFCGRYAGESFCLPAFDRDCPDSVHSFFYPVRQRIGGAQFLVCGDCIPFDGRINCGRHFSLPED